MSNVCQYPIWEPITADENKLVKMKEERIRSSVSAHGDGGQVLVLMMITLKM